jgi:2-keto-4-pentenoate hydratase/2-oxohepta-3-ene-1,7-dioic acid hydratase in catechol pathway
MKLMTFRPPRARMPHFGVLLSNGKVYDLSLARLPRLPGSLLACIERGEKALAAVRAAHAAAEERLARGEPIAETFDPEAIDLLPPVMPGKIMAVGRNYPDHAAEVGSSVYSRPNGFIKNASCVIGSGDTIRKPRWTDKLDYETELAVVIGRECVNATLENAMDFVFGYTIMNDLSARDVQYAERKEGNIMIGKNFPTAAPLGPWIVTRDEIPDPHNLRLVTRVNGGVRQAGNTSQQLHRIASQIAWYSCAGLLPGDIVSTGSPSGTGAGYQGPGTWFLQHGDNLECEIEGIGVLKNPVRNSRL